MDGRKAPSKFAHTDIVCRPTSRPGIAQATCAALLALRSNPASIRVDHILCGVVPAYHLKNALGASEIMTSSSFFLAVNYPWLDYGCDLGRSPWGYSGLASPHARDIVSADFARICSSGVSVVRWFLLCDGRSGVRYENGIPAGPDDFLFTDVAAALDLASRSSLQICFSLFDFLWLQTPDAP